MLLEEYRLHSALFGRRRFVAFPLFTAGLVGVGIWLLQLTGTPLGTVIGGLFLLVFFFGLQVGTIGLVGRDAMRDVLGGVTLLVFSARTLPVSRRWLLAVFLVKDFVYYVVLFLTPVVIGFLPTLLAGDLSLSAISLLWVTIAATFAFGAATSLTLAGIATRSSVGLIALLAAIGVGFYYAPSTLLDLTPYAFYADQSVESALGSAAALGVVLIAGPILFEPPRRGGARRVETDRFQRIQTRWGGMTARPLFEVSRSSGSVWKVGFSLGILFVVTALLLDRIVVATGIEPSAGIAFGTLLGLGAFTTYNWVTQLDDPREYLRYPATLDRVFAGKFRAYLVLSIPTGFCYLALAAIWYPPADLVLGVVVFPLVSIYVFGVTAYLTGLSPNELLFDTTLFARYGFALAAVAVPLLVASLAAGEYPYEATAVAIGVSLAGAVFGSVLTRRTGNRWHDRLRKESSVGDR